MNNKNDNQNKNFCKNGVYLEKKKFLRMNTLEVDDIKLS